MAACTEITNETTISCPKCFATGARNEEINVLFGECPTCNFVFCTNCNNDFHGYEDCPTEQFIAATIGDINIIPLTSQTHETSLPSSNIDCEICFESTPIENTTDLGCPHLFCNTCLKGFYEALIKEGSVHSLKCASPNCDQSVTPEVLKELIDPEVFITFDLKLLDEVLQDIPEIVCCPKPGCGRRFQSLPEYGYCESCDYMFCTNCNQTYHGMTICGESEAERLRRIKAYIAADEEEKRRLEEEEKNKRKLQDEQSDGFINQVCKRCPHCRANIEKFIGCNRMTCTKCNTHFCWICLVVLNPADPYNHFKVAGALCALY